MEQKLGGLKCDTPHCNYFDPDIPVEDYPKWIGKPCPVCGRSLLTEEDYIAFMAIIEANKRAKEFEKKHKFLAKLLKGKYIIQVSFNGGGFKTAKYTKRKRDEA